MNCPKCNTADATHVARTGVFGPSVHRTRRCDACAVEWQTEEVQRGDYRQIPVRTGDRQQAPATAGKPSVSSESEFSLSLSGSDSVPRRSSGDRETDESAGAAMVVKPPTLHQQVIDQFCTAFRVARGVEYHVEPADRSQVGRFLSPAKPTKPPAPELIAELPVIFANFVGTADPFDQKHGLAFLLTKALNRYRAGGKPKAAPVHPKDRAYVEAIQRPFPRKATP